MKYKKKIMLLFCTAVFLAACVKEDIIETKITESTYPLAQYISVEHAGDNADNFCIVSNDDLCATVVPGKYVMGDDTIIKHHDTVLPSEHSIAELVQFILYFYDIHTLELVKTIDVKRLAEPYMKEWQINSGGFLLGQENGKYYVVLTLRSRHTVEELIEKQPIEYRYLWVDIEEGTAELREEGTEFWSLPLSEDIWLFPSTEFNEINGLDGIDISELSYLDDTSYISIPTQYLPEHNEKLYGMFPKLKNVSREEGLYAHIYLRPGANNFEAISLLFDEGKELDFKSLKPDEKGSYGAYRVAGERHYVTAEE